MYDEWNIQNRKMTNKAETHIEPPSGNLATCTGCGACAVICPSNSIKMQPDGEGFIFPTMDSKTCNNCELCRKTCPINPQVTAVNSYKILDCEKKPLAVFASWHINENVRRESSSGGVFTELAENILTKGGAVVGAAFDDKFVVRHILIDTIDDLYRLRGSKYVQSDISSNLYFQIQDQLKQGSPVLFSGTPCQVAGIKRFFCEPSDNLFFLDLVCHGVPSPLLLSEFLKSEFNPQKGLLRSISFRQKTRGWKKYFLQLTWDKQITCIEQSCSYMAAYLRNYSLRPCCYNCKFTNTNRPGDVTLADFWGVAKKYPKYDLDDKGTSLILVNTEKGKTWIDDCHSNLFLGGADLNTAVTGNLMLVHPCQRPPQRETFYFDLKNLPFPAVIRKYHLYGPTKHRLLVRKIKRQFWNIVQGLSDWIEPKKRIK